MNAKSLRKSLRKVRAEAASWVTRLHGPERNAALEAGLKQWLAQDPEHAKAFELATEVWQDTADLPAEMPKRALGQVPGDPPHFRSVFAYAAAIGIIALGLIGYTRFFGENALTTDIGEQRTITLADGTRVELNTRSAMLVKYDERARRVVLTAGEAYFDVVSQKERPFIVTAGEREIIALGTAFLVRHDPGEISVTLLQGRVAVAAAAEETSKQKHSTSDMQVLRPGERLRVRNNNPPLRDSPSIDKVTAWQRGQVIFEDTPLSEAAAEFNRYSVNQIRVDSEELGRIRVGGTFRIGDVGSFARAVAASHDLEVIDRGQHVLITHVPK